MYLFAYGTLQPTANGNFFETSQLKAFLTPYCKGVVRGELVHLRNQKQQLDYPGLVNVNTSTRSVTGTVFEVHGDKKAFSVIDQYEGFDPELTASQSNTKNYYKRVELDVQTEFGEVIKAEVYVLNKDSDYYHEEFITEIKSVEGGDWLKHMGIEK